MARQIAERRAERAEPAVPRDSTRGSGTPRSRDVATVTRDTSRKGRGGSPDLLMRHAISNRRCS